LSFFQRAFYLHLELVFYTSPGGLFPLRRKISGNRGC
jgi:hypothetical protein